MIEIVCLGLSAFTFSTGMIILVKAIQENISVKKDLEINNDFKVYESKIEYKNENIDLEYINKLPHSNVILDFVNKIESKNLTENINKLMIEENIKRNPGEAGNYGIISQKIRLYNTSKNTLRHELFHLSSSIVDYENKILFSGFQQDKNKSAKGKRKLVGTCLNEGYTTYFTSKMFPEDESFRAYRFEVKIVKLIEEFLLETNSQKLYLENNLNGLIEQLCKYNTYENVKKFILATDNFTNHKDKCLLTSKTRIKLKEEYTFINRFLLESYINKLEQSNLNYSTYLKDLVKFYNSMYNMNRNHNNINAKIPIIDPNIEIENNKVKKINISYE